MSQETPGTPAGTLQSDHPLDTDRKSGTTVGLVGSPCVPELDESTFAIRVSRTVTADEHVRELSSRPRPRHGHRLLGRALGLAALLVIASMLTSTYTFCVGAFLLAFVLLAALGGRRVEAWSLRHSFESSAVLHGDQLHGVDQEGISFWTVRLSARSRWSNLVSHWAHEGRLQLQCRGMPLVVVPVHALEEAGCLDAVLALARRAGEGTGPPPKLIALTEPPERASFRVHARRTVSLRDVTPIESLVRTWRGGLVVAAVLALAVALMLLSRYTFSLGLLVALLEMGLLVSPSIFRRRDLETGRWSHLAGEQEHGVDGHGVWLRTAQLALRAPWTSVYGHRLTGHELHLFAHRLPRVVLPIESLVEAGCYDEVMWLAQRYGERLPADAASG